VTIVQLHIHFAYLLSTKNEEQIAKNSAYSRGGYINLYRTTFEYHYFSKWSQNNKLYTS